MTLKTSVVSGVRWTGLSSLCTASADILRILVLARFLKAEDYGLMAMVSIVVGLAQVYADLGINAAIIHRQDATKPQLSSLYWLSIAMGLCLFTFVWFTSPWIALALGEPRIVSPLHAMSAIFIIAPLGSQFEVLLQKELSFKTLARWEISASLFGTATAVACAVSGFGVWALVLSALGSQVVKTLLLLRVGLNRFRPGLYFSRSDLKGYAGFGLYQMGERSVNYIAERLDQTIVGVMLGAQTLGFYNFALYLTAQPISRINPILTKVAFPVFARLQSDPEQLRRGYLRLLGLVATINAPLLIGLASVAAWVIPLMFGDRWLPSVILVQLLSLVALSRSLGNPIGSLQLARGRADLGFWWNVILLLASLPAIYIGSVVGGATGVAGALLLLQVVVNVPLYLLLIRPLLGRCLQDYLRVTLKPIAFALVMGFVVVLFPAWHGRQPSAPDLLTRILLGGAIYAVLVGTMHRRTVLDMRSALLSR